ncbi:MAG: YceD family protein [Christensenellales bacterium]|jgi:uncharacterized protein
MLLDLMDALKNQGDSRPFKISGCLPDGFLPDDVKLTSPVTVSGTMTAFGHDVALVGEAFTEADVRCGLCLKPLKIKISFDYGELLRRQGYQGEDEDVAEEDVQELMYFDGSSCDISESVAHALLLHLPMRHVCSQDCKGLCAGCGKDLNEGACVCGPDENSPFAALASLFTEEE